MFKFALVIFLFVQNGLDVQIVNTRIDRRTDEGTCKALEITETKVLPLQDGNDARWQWAKCVQVES